MENIENLFTKDACLMIEKFYYNLKKAKNHRNQLFIAYKNTFNLAVSLIKLMRESKHSNNLNILSTSETIAAFREETLLPFLAEYDEEFLPFLKSDDEFKNIINDSLERHNINHDQWIIDIINDTKATWEKLLTIEKKIIV